MKRMFRVHPDKPFDGPHQLQQAVTAGAERSEAEAAMILVHGRGASAESILTLAGELEEPGLHYVAPQASGSTWYPFSFLAPVEQNQPGLSSGLQAIHDLVEELVSGGIPVDKILLLGFSQGACLVTEYVARHPARYGGVAGLSGGLIGETVSADEYAGSLEETPVFLGCSDIDAHIPVERVHLTAEILEKLGGRVLKKIYPGMGHTVNRDEIEEVKEIIQGV